MPCMKIVKIYENCLLSYVGLGNNFVIWMGYRKNFPKKRLVFDEPILIEFKKPRYYEYLPAF